MVLEMFNLLSFGFSLEASLILPAHPAIHQPTVLLVALTPCLPARTAPCLTAAPAAIVDWPRIQFLFR